MKYPIAIEAYIETMQGNFRECRQVVHNDLEATSFKIRYSNCIIKLLPLNTEEQKEIDMEMSIIDAIDKVVLFLAAPENRDNNFPIVDLMTELAIPSSLHTVTAQRLFQKHYIKGGPALKNPIIWIDAKGLSYAEELENKHFEEHGTPINAKRLPALPINEVCEILFQMHKNHDYKVVWTKETYNNQPSNLGAAKDVLIKKDIIYIDHTSRQKITKLNPDYFEDDTFEEANRRLAESMNKTQGTTSVIMRDGVAMINSDIRDLSAFSLNTNPPSAPTFAETKQGNKNAVINWVLEHIVLVIVLAIISGLIVAYFTNLFKWN